MALDFSQMEVVTDEAGGIDFGAMEASDGVTTETQAVDDTSKPKTKQDLINEEYEIRKKSILAKEGLIDTNRELLLNKNEQERIDKIEEADARDRDKRAKEEGISAPSRFQAGLEEFQGQFEKNVILPVTKLMGLKEDFSKYVEEKGESKIKAGEKVAEQFKEIYGEDAWNIAQTLGNVTPEVVGAIASGTGKVVPATVGAGLEYARTGSAYEAAKTGLLDLFGGALADKIFKTGKLSKFGEDIKNLPPDKRDFATSAIDAMEEAGVDKIDEQARKEILSKIDFSKPSTEVSKNLIDEISILRKQTLDEIDDAYRVANDSVDTSIKKQIPTFNRKDDAFKDILFDDDARAALKDINKRIAEEGKSGNLDVSQIEIITRAIDRYNAKGTGKAVKSIMKKKLREAQTDMLPEGKKDVYENARSMYTDYLTKFTSRRKGEGGEIGKSIEDVIATNQAYEVASDILSSGMNPNRAKALKDIGLTNQSKVDAVKDVLIKGLNEKNLAENDGISTIVNRYKSSNKNAVRELLGNEYKKFDSNMKALEMINNTLKDSPVDEGLTRNIINFATNASMIKVSPLYGYKGMAYEGREIANKIAFRKAGNELKSRVNKFVKSKTVANRLTKAINMSMASSAGNFIESKDDSTYPKDFIKKD